jgi:hypothetical protein
VPLSPPPVIDLNLVLARQIGRSAEQSREFEITYACLNATGGADAHVIANTLQDAFHAAWASRFSVFVTLLRTEVLLGLGNNTPAVGVSTTSVNPGTDANTMAPAQVSLLVKKASAFAGRKNRGRMFFPFVVPDPSVTEAGLIDPTILTGLQLSASNWLASLVAANLSMVIANKTFNQPLPPHHVTSVTEGKIVTTLTAEGLVATQRRRLGR